jgi:hypothetical protein
MGSSVGEIIGSLRYSQLYVVTDYGMDIYYLLRLNSKVIRGGGGGK